MTNGSITGAKDVWIIGAAGQLGASLVEVYGDRALPFTRAELDLDDYESMHADLVAAALIHPPKIIFNATAYNAVDQAESDQDACVRLNVRAPRALAEFAREASADFYHYSTDFVFSGEGEHAWREDDEAAPINFYGHSKLAGEREVLDTNPCARVLRTSWVYSDRRANFVLSILKAARGRARLSVVEDQVGSPTYALGLAESSASIARRTSDPSTGGVYHLSDAGFVSRADFAREILKRASAFEPGLAAVEVESTRTADQTAAAARPLNTRLDLTKVSNTFGVRPVDWRVNLGRALERYYERS